MDRRAFSRLMVRLLAAAGTRRMCAVTGAAHAATAGIPDLGLNAKLNGMRLFSRTQWRRDVSALPLHPQSTLFIGSLGMHPYSQDAGGWSYAGSVVGTPYFVADSRLQPLVPIVCSQYLGECDLVYAPVPLRDDIVQGYPANATYPEKPSEEDRHVLLIDRRLRVCYELYRAYRRVDHWYCANMAVWDLDDGDSQRPLGDTSADVAGQSILAGLIRGEEVEHDAINHAFRFTIPDQCPVFISPPASHASAFGNSNALPFGGRIRLKASVSETSKPGGGAWNRKALRILRALKKYGMINSDTGLALSADGDTSAWDTEDLGPGPAWRDLRLLTTRDFEAVDTGGLRIEAVHAAPAGPAPTASLESSATEIRSGESIILTPSWQGKTLAWMIPVGGVMRTPQPVTDTPIRDAWYQLEVVNPHGRTRRLRRVIVTDGLRRHERYDRYIGPQGSASNDGLTPGTPWPLSILKDPNNVHLLAGAVLGLLDGLYVVAADPALDRENGVDGDHPWFEVPTGIFGKPTVLQSLNPRRAVFDGGSNARPILGSRNQGLSLIQIIGLQFNTPAANYSVSFVGDGAFLVDDCEFSGFKVAAIRASHVNSPFIRGNTARNRPGTHLVQLDGCSDVHLRANVLDVAGHLWADRGGNAAVQAD
jgi:hypothetical protein